MRLRVLQIGKFYYPVPGGMEDHLYHLCNELKDRCELRVVVANTKPKTEISNVDGVEVIRVFSLGEIFSVLICPTMFVWLRKFSPNIFHLHLPNPMAHVSYILARPKAKLIITWHSDVVKRVIRLQLYKPFLVSLLHRAERIIATSPAYVKHSPFLNKFRDKTKVVPLGIDLKKFQSNRKVQKTTAEIRSKFGGRIILFAGRLTYYKGLEYLIEAMRHVEGGLIIIGSGRLEKKLRNQVNNFELQSKVTFLGEVSHQDIVCYFQACDLLVLPSVERSEAFGIVQLEAMACSKPVISTKLRTGVPWVNEDGKTGIVVPPRNSGALAQAINALLEDPSLRKKYGENGRIRVEKEFTKERVAMKTLDLYKETFGSG
ncbi:MAG: glycosyltransferase [Candidatus Hodarchaeota archaeon]